jgi:hypothetical protein
LQGDVQGRDVEYWKVLDRIKIVRIKGLKLRFIRNSILFRYGDADEEYGRAG